MRAFLLGAVLLAAAGEASSPPCETVTCVARRATHRYQGCYKAALERDSPTVSGKAVLTITLRENGTVEKVAVDFPAASPLFALCLREATLKLRFSEPQLGNVVVLPLSFDPGR